MKAIMRFIKSFAITCTSLVSIAQCAPTAELMSRANSEGFVCTFPTTGGNPYSISLDNIVTVMRYITDNQGQRGLSSYPHSFANYAGSISTYSRCQNQPLYEFPVYDNSAFTPYKLFEKDMKNYLRGPDNYNPPFRIIYTQAPKEPYRTCPEPPILCAVITHTDPKTPITDRTAVPSDGGGGGFAQCQRTWTM